jgi:hypothetical protein
MVRAGILYTQLLASNKVKLGLVNSSTCGRFHDKEGGKMYVLYNCDILFEWDFFS